MHGALSSIRAFVLILLVPLASGAQTVVDASPPAESSSGTAAAAPAFELPPGYDGPPPPEPPAVITRDAAGRATMRAFRVARRPRIDGVLDEPHYREVPPITGFIQMEPRFGEPATERTDAWVAFDDEHVYVSFRAWDSQMDRLIATEMRRDSSNTWQGNDIISFIFDTFFDRRSSIAFTINPAGGRSDGQIVNERQYSMDWNPVWEVKTGRFEGGWTIEAAIPFKSIRYRPGTRQVWGFNAMRVKRSKNEISTITLVPPARGQQGFQQPSFAGLLVGIEAPPAGRTFDLKPYVASNFMTDRVARPSDPSVVKGNYGLDAKFAVTEGLTADFTYRTDFAQVEADEQQVNLTRFSLFFPEKREFFLENQGIFAFGGINPNRGGGGGGGGGGDNNAGGDAPILFYSRRIGLNQNRQVPLEAGGRLTGRAGAYSIGLINIQTGEEPESGTRSTNFTVVRLRRDVLARSAIGLMFTNRSIGADVEPSNRAYGADATFNFFENLQVNTYWAKTDTPGRRGRDTSYRTQLDYQGDRYTVQLDRLAVGDDFNPGIGFVRRHDMIRNMGRFRFTPRPKQPSIVRKYSYEVSLKYVTDGEGRLESRDRQLEFGIDFQNADRLEVRYNDLFEFLPGPSIIGSVLLPVGAYRFDNVRVQYDVSQQRPVSGSVTIEYGTFYNGRKTTLSVGRGRMPLTTRLSIEPTYSLNRVRLVQGNFTAHLAGSRITFTPTPLMFVSVLMQYNSSGNLLSTNARFRWEYRPGSELFVVYNEERDTLARSFPALVNRAFIVKVNRLLRF